MQYFDDNLNGIHAVSVAKIERIDSLKNLLVYMKIQIYTLFFPQFCAKFTKKFLRKLATLQISEKA